MNREGISPPPLRGADSSRPLPQVRDNVWNEAFWKTPLSQFSRATGLTLYVQDMQGKCVLGPYSNGPLAAMLDVHGALTHPNAVLHVERLVAECVLQKKAVAGGLANSLILAALPMLQNREIVGCLLYGWVFDHFTSPLECERLATLLDLPVNLFWTVARQQPPVSRDKLAVYADLLSTLTDALLAQLSSLNASQETAREKDRFLATVSHELKTPLTSLLLASQGLGRNPSVRENDKIRRQVRTIENSAKMQCRLVDDLLDAARLMVGKLRMERSEIDVKTAIAAAISVIASSASEKSILITTDLPDEACVLHGDSLRLQQVFWNILSNAVKFTPPLGKINVRVAQGVQNVVIQVKDSGRGIESSFLPDIFERFSQSAEALGPSNRGLGLGLSISQQIVKLHAGHIKAESDGLGHGTLITVSLPRMF